MVDDFALNVTTPGTDTTPPTTSITSPANGATVSGTVTINATASDNVGVTQMQILIDGAVAASNTNATSLSFSWNTTTVANGSHTIVSKAFDAAGNVGTSSTITVTVSNGGGTITELIGNGGFENGAASPAPWVLTSTHTPLSIINSSATEPPHTGTFDAWMNGWGTTITDTVMQQVTIPANATAATFSFWLHIDTAETTTTTAFDTLQVQVRNSSGTVLQTLATFSNLNHATGYQQQTFNVLSFAGQTIQVFFVGSGRFLVANLVCTGRHFTQGDSIGDAMNRLVFGTLLLAGLAMPALAVPQSNQSPDAPPASRPSGGAELRF